MLRRRTKAEVLAELAPEKRRLVQQIDCGRRGLSRADAARGSSSCACCARTGEMSPSPPRAASMDQPSRRQQRQATGVAKAPFVCASSCEALLESGERVLLMAHHHAVMDIYRAASCDASPSRLHHRPGDRATQKDAAASALHVRQRANLVLRLAARRPAD